MMDLRLDGNTLSFKTMRKGDGAVLNWEMRLLSEDEAELQAVGDSRIVRLVKDK
jgi:hypothetical protein